MSLKITRLIVYEAVCGCCKKEFKAVYNNNTYTHFSQISDWQYTDMGWCCSECIKGKKK